MSKEVMPAVTILVGHVPREKVTAATNSGKALLPKERNRVLTGYRNSRFFLLEPCGGLPTPFPA